MFSSTGPELVSSIILLTHCCCSAEKRRQLDVHGNLRVPFVCGMQRCFVAHYCCGNAYPGKDRYPDQKIFVSGRPLGDLPGVSQCFTKDPSIHSLRIQCFPSLRFGGTVGGFSGARFVGSSRTEPEFGTTGSLGISDRSWPPRPTF